MTVNAAVSDYDGRWIMEDGVLAFVYPSGGDFDGEITISGGQLRFESPYKFNSLVFHLGNTPDGPARIKDLSMLSGGRSRLTYAARRRAHIFWRKERKTSTG